MFLDCCFATSGDSVLHRYWPTARKCIRALVRAVGRTEIPCLRHYAVTAAKCVGADLLHIAVQETAEVVNCIKDFKRAARSVREILRKNLDSGSGKPKEVSELSGGGGGGSRVLPTKSVN